MTLAARIQSVRPTIFLGVPRVWEKIYSRVLVLAQEATPIGRLCCGSASSPSTHWWRTCFSHRRTLSSWCASPGRALHTPRRAALPLTTLRLL